MSRRTATGPPDRDWPYLSFIEALARRANRTWTGRWTADGWTGGRQAAPGVGEGVGERWAEVVVGVEEKHTRVVPHAQQ